MSTEREVAEKLKEAIEKRDLDVFLPYLTDDMTYEVLPSTFVVVVLVGLSSRVLTVTTQNWKEGDKGRMEGQHGWYTRCRGVCRGGDITAKLHGCH